MIPNLIEDNLNNLLLYTIQQRDCHYVNLIVVMGACILQHCIFLHHKYGKAMTIFK